MNRIQFIIAGWHFEEFPEFIEELLRVDQNSASIFWSCHRQPSKVIQDSFEYKVFPNLGLEDGAYQQALDYLDLEDDVLLFLLHDDIIIKNWQFVNTIADVLFQKSEVKFFGNGRNYPASLSMSYMPLGKPLKSFIKQESLHLFDRDLHSIPTLRESFVATLRGSLRYIHDFEVVWQSPPSDGHIGGIGNLQQTLLAYKIMRVFGNSAIRYLSSTYLDSNFLYEVPRGKRQN